MNQFYRKQIMMIQLFMRGCIWYGIFILLDYQKCLKTGEFHPWLALSLFPVMALLSWITGIKKQKLRIVLLIAVTAVLLEVTPLPWYFLLAETLLQFMVLKEKEEQALRFGVVWERWLYQMPGICLMLLLLILHRLWSDNNNPNLTYSPEYAGRFLLVSWIVYLILYMINQYMKNFYGYFRYRKNKVTSEMFHRAKRSNYAMMVVLGISGLAVMALVTLIPMGFYNWVLLVLKKIAAFILGLILPDLENSEIVHTQVGEHIGTPGSAPSGASMAGGENGAFIYAVGAVLLVLLAVVVLSKLFKNILGQYKVETDQAEFVSIREENQETYQRERQGWFQPKYGKSNREKIRKVYYQKVVKQLKKQSEEKRDMVLDSCTPQELSRLLATTPAEREDMKKLTDYYEKARFAKEDSTEEEVREAEALL